MDTGIGTAGNSGTAGNKSIVQRAMAGLVEQGDVAALAAFLSDDFVHHRPDGRTSAKAEWLAAVRAAREPTAGMRVEVLHLLADGDHVVVHTRRRLPGAGTPAGAHPADAQDAGAEDGDAEDADVEDADVEDAGAEVQVVDVVRLDGGLITGIWEVIEPAGRAAANLSWWRGSGTAERDRRDR